MTPFFPLFITTGGEGKDRKPGDFDLDNSVELSLISLMKTEKKKQNTKKKTTRTERKRNEMERKDTPLPLFF
ncbi:hypothetical protein CABS01_04386 [Colletotrichum abscissum]|uniref:uncharacterized protein n=1 Tax=Colletotrichum abscissum TaxID=1671311 RepID=UPI0027D6CC74|nr:uncharacterized protein CABS01_04386 [Colletotrichum abscissum]KAK1473724.1 hypothetical protein CABS01_04386 [Colletotrichum abscissum]